MNIAMLLEMAAGTFGDRVAIGDRTDGIRFDALLDLSSRFAHALSTRDIDRLLWTDITSAALPVALFGAAKADKPFVPLNYRLATDRLHGLIEKQAPALLLQSPDPASRFAGSAKVECAHTHDFVEALKSSASSLSGNVSDDPESVAVLLHTSGTSGDPKIAILRHRHLTSYVLGSVDFMSADEDEAALVSVPPYHIAGIASILTSTFSGRRLVQMASFDAAEWVRLVRTQHITHAMVVPTMMARITEELGDGIGLPTLRHLSYGGGRMPLPIVERAMELLPHVNFVNAYGLTETSSSIAILDPDDHRNAMASSDPAVRKRLGSVGRPLPSLEISIRDADGELVGVGQQGEVWVRGEQVSGEYVNTSAVNSRTDEPGGTSGWFPTKDGGYLDDDGYLFIDGRIDDVIVRGGENLSPGEIEDVLLTHSGVSDACVVGVPDVEWGEAVAAFIVLAPGSTVTEVEIQTWVVSHLRSSRQPKVVLFRDELPYNDLGKVLRRVLRDEYQQLNQ
jgi:acyl-CoA synthetase (AMP-forming)/AMP-acid ligase II